MKWHLIFLLPDFQHIWHLIKWFFTEDSLKFSDEIYLDSFFSLFQYYFSMQSDGLHRSVKQICIHFI